MSTPAKLTAFAVLLVAAFLGGAALGEAVGPIAVDGAGHAPPPTAEVETHDGH